MSFFANLFRKSPDPRDMYRTLWQATVAKAREPFWYLDGDVADTREGRFDMITAIMAFVIVRLEKANELAGAAAYLTELFVEDMEGQLREEGIGDPTVGKRIGAMMSALGGRIGAYSGGLAGASDMEQAVERNMTMNEHGSVAVVAEHMSDFHAQLAKLSDEELLAGTFAEGAPA